MEAYNYNGGEAPTVEYPSYCDQYEKDENEEEDDMQEQMEKVRACESRRDELRKYVFRLPASCAHTSIHDVSATNSDVVSNVV